MFTLHAIFKASKSEEYAQLDEAFKIVEKDAEGLEKAVEAFPEATKFIITNDKVIPILNDGIYEIMNDDKVIKTIY